jgi:hypothetical protein
MIALTSVGEAADKTRRPRARAACTRVCPPLAMSPSHFHARHFTLSDSAGAAVRPGRMRAR